MRLSLSTSKVLRLGGAVRVRQCRPRVTPPSCFQGDSARKKKDEHPKKTIEEITSSQPSAAEPGGKMGAFDPNSQPEAESGGDRSYLGPDTRPFSRGLVAKQITPDEELARDMKPFLLEARAHLQDRKVQQDDPGYFHKVVASAAMDAAERSAALPTLPHNRRTRILQFLTDVAAELGEEESTNKSAKGSGPCGSFPSEGRNEQELQVDGELRSAMAPLLMQTRARLARSQGEVASPHAIAAAAVAAAEASGALPPLAGPQRVAVEAFFARMATDLEDNDTSEQGFEAFGSSGGEALYGEEDAVLRIRPHQRELMEAVINAHLSKSGSTRRSKSPSDSVSTGGEVGNIALQSDTHHMAEPQGVPAESESDRAEKQAEADFEELELADLPHADPTALKQQEEQQPENMASYAAIEGDAPAAGDGMQVVDLEDDVSTSRHGTHSTDSEQSMVSDSSADEGVFISPWPPFS